MKLKWWHTHDWTQWEKTGEAIRYGKVLGFVQERRCKTCGFAEIDKQII